MCDVNLDCDARAHPALRRQNTGNAMQMFIKYSMSLPLRYELPMYPRRAQHETSYCEFLPYIRTGSNEQRKKMRICPHPIKCIKLLVAVTCGPYLKVALARDNLHSD